MDPEFTFLNFLSALSFILEIKNTVFLFIFDKKSHLGAVAKTGKATSNSWLSKHFLKTNDIHFWRDINFLEILCIKHILYKY